MSSAEILASYEQHRPLYGEFASECEGLTKKLLNEAGLKDKIHAVTSRPKEVESLARKLDLPGKSYAQLTDVTDLAGVRIVTFFSDDVDLVARVIEERFDVDWDHSIDKRQTLAPEAFGYLSVHYVVRLSQSRRNLPENARFCDLFVEIQVRSILQHAWAEIQHDLGYKSFAAIPRDYERRFSRLAGLFELGR